MRTQLYPALLLFLLILTLISACSPAPRTGATPPSIPASVAPATQTPAPTPTDSPTALPSPTLTSSPSPTSTPLSVNRFGQIENITSPDGNWTAILNTKLGSLDLQGRDGRVAAIFPAGSTAADVSWSPDSRHLLVVQNHYVLSAPGVPVVSESPIEIWDFRVNPIQKPVRVFRSQPKPLDASTFEPEEIRLGKWSPNSRYVLFWLSPLIDNVDGLTPLVLDIETTRSTRLAEVALDNPRYQSWAPDSSALAFTAGGYRSAQVNKWLNLFNVATGQVTTVISKREAVPGIVAWSPRGDLIAYAAVSAADTGEDWADWMSFDNKAILARRVYLLNPKTGKHWRLNQVDAFQDAPAWSDDGFVLYYIQRQGDSLVLMAADPSNGQAQVIQGTRRPAPNGVGYYGQSNWDDLLAHRPSAPRAAVPALSLTFTDAQKGYSLRYPNGWHIGRGWKNWENQCYECTTISPTADEPPRNFGPFSGQAFISIEAFADPQSDLDALLRGVLVAAGPEQLLNRGAILTAFDQRKLTMNGQPALRLETMGEFGEVNHVLILLDRKRGFVLRAQGDGRVFDAVAATLRLQ